MKKLIVIALLAVADLWLISVGYRYGADNLTVLLTIGGGFCLPIFGESRNEQAMFISFVAIVVGLIFALTSAGIIAAVALFFSALATFIAMGILIND